NEKVSCV
nr:Chain B, 5-hydroxytryptamine receptor 2A peptide [Rattus norvegicus]